MQREKAAGAAAAALVFCAPYSQLAWLTTVQPAAGSSADEWLTLQGCRCEGLQLSLDLLNWPHLLLDGIDPQVGGVLVRLEVGIPVAPDKPLPHSVKPVWVHLEANQLLEDVVNQ